MALKITRRLLRSIADAAKNPQNHLHIISREGGKWIIKKEGAKRAFGIYSSIDQAIKVATASVKSGKAEAAIVHDMYGRVAKKIV